MLKRYMENNIIFTEYKIFNNLKDMISHIETLSFLYKDKEERLIISIEPQNLELYIKILKHNMFIGVFSKN